MKIEGYAKEIADFFSLGYYSSAYFKIEIERVPDMHNNDSATTAEKFPSDPPKHGSTGREKETLHNFYASPAGIVIED